MYRTLIVAHRWIALITSAFLVVIALSGSLLVLEGPVSRAQQLRVTPSGEPLSLDTLAARARAVSGGGTVDGVSLGDSPDLAWYVSLRPSANGRAGASVVLDPYTGAVLTEPIAPTPAAKFIRNVHLLHTRLLGGNAGRTLVAIATLAAFVLVLSGVFIWWREKLWRVNMQASWKRINFDLHHSLGIFSSVVLLVITGTGIWVHYDRIDDVMRKLNRSPAPAPPLSESVQRGSDSGSLVISLDSLAHVARMAVPGAAIMNMQLPSDPRPAMVQLKYPEDHTPAGRSRVYIDTHRGTVLLAMSTRTAQPGQHMIDIKRALHTGDVYGWPTQLVWALASLVLAAQAVTGVLMWWNAKRRLV